MSILLLKLTSTPPLPNNEDVTQMDDIIKNFGIGEPLWGGMFIITYVIRKNKRRRRANVKYWGWMWSIVVVVVVVV